jgi:hypothetical protein
MSKKRNSSSSSNSKRKFKRALVKSEAFLLSDAFRAQTLSEDPTMLSTIPYLARINRYGFLTTNSQRGKTISKGNKEDFFIDERAYIMGFMLTSEAKKLIEWINTQTDKVAIHLPYFDDLNSPIEMPTHLWMPLTIRRNKKTLQVKDVITHMSSAMEWSALETSISDVDIGFQLTDFIPKENFNRSNRASPSPIAFLFCFDIKWHRDAIKSKNGLFRDVIRALQKM